MSKEHLIIEEAKKIFIEKGINGTSIDDISKACKISKATFYKYFENKESVIISILKNNKSNLENSCKNIDSNFDIQSIDKLKKKIITIWEYKYKAYDFNSYIARVLSKSNEELNKLQNINRAYIIDEYRKSLLMAYGYNIKNIMWDVIFVIDGLIYEFIILMRNNKQNFDSEFVGDFILNIVDNIANTLNNKNVFMSKNILYGLDGYENKFTYKDYENYFYQRLNEVKDIIHKNSKIENKNKLLKAVDEIENQANNNNYNSLIMDAMIAFLATERSLTDKIDSLNRIKENLGDEDNEK